MTDEVTVADLESTVWKAWPVSGDAIARVNAGQVTDPYDWRGIGLEHRDLHAS